MVPAFSQWLVILDTMYIIKCPRPEATAANPGKNKWLLTLMDFFLYSRAGSWNHGFSESLQKKLPAAFMDSNGWFGRGFCWFDFVSKWWFREIHTYNVQTWMHINLTRCVHSGLSRLAKSNRRIQRKTESPSWYYRSTNFPIQSM